MTVSTRRTRASGAGPRGVSVWARLVMAALTLGCVAATAGCRVNENDVHRWESTERGPDKLVAVVEHDKYAFPLRTEAAVSLIRMRPRSGRRIGIELLMSALTEISPDARQKIVDGMTPELVHQMQPGAP